MSSQVICKLRIHTYLICDCLFVDGLSNQPAVLLTQHTRWWNGFVPHIYFIILSLGLFFLFSPVDQVYYFWNAYAIFYIFLFLLRYCSITEWYNGSFILYIYTTCHYCFNIPICCKKKIIFVNTFSLQWYGFYFAFIQSTQHRCMRASRVVTHEVCRVMRINSINKYWNVYLLCTINIQHSSLIWRIFSDQLLVILEISI